MKVRFYIVVAFFAPEPKGEVRPKKLCVKIILDEKIAVCVKILLRFKRVSKMGVLLGTKESHRELSKGWWETVDLISFCLRSAFQFCLLNPLLASLLHILCYGLRQKIY